MPKGKVMLKTASKRVALLVVAVMISLSWAQSGSSANCTIERGIDPLDVLKTGMRHNVWFALDLSGSMDKSMLVDDPDLGRETTRINTARKAIFRILDEFKDASGKPLYNWGFTYFDMFSRQIGKECGGSGIVDVDGDGYWDNPTNCEGMSPETISST